MHKILRAFLTLANKEERQILQSIIQNKRYPLVLVEQESLDFLVIYIIAYSKRKKSLYKYIDKNYAGTINIITKILLHPNYQAITLNL